MKIFNGGDKVNFVDEMNVLIGYDLGQSCCERADWYIAESEMETEEENKFNGDLTPYIFDRNYFWDGSLSGEYAEGGIARFKLVAEDKPDLYLHIFNSHNGYYGHGFDALIGGQRWQHGYL